MGEIFSKTIEQKGSKLIVVYDDPSANFAGVIHDIKTAVKGLAVAGPLEPTEMKENAIVAYIVPTPTERLEQNFNEKRFQQTKEASKNVFFIQLRYGTNDKSFADSSEKNVVQLIYNGENLISCDFNTSSLAKLKHLVTQAK